MTSLLGLSLVIGPMIIGFMVFLIFRIFNFIRSIGRWILDFIREVRNKPKYQRQDPYVSKTIIFKE